MTIILACGTVLISDGGGEVKVTSRKLRSPLKWHGGKSYLARRIIALMPEHRTYVEPFAGGLSVLLNKPKAKKEIAGDLNQRLIEFWEVVRDEPDRLLEDLGEIPYEHASFLRATLSMDSPGKMWRSEAFMIANRMSRGGLFKDFAWSDRLRGGQPGEVNSWQTIRAELPVIAERIRDVVFVSCRAGYLLGSEDGPDTLFYLDPPYLHETRTAKKAYEFEMSAYEHTDLLGIILDLKGTVMISGYRSGLYDSFLRDWHRIDFDMPNHSGQGKTKQRRTECLWLNRPIPVAGD